MRPTILMGVAVRYALIYLDRGRGDLDSLDVPVGLGVSAICQPYIYSWWAQIN